MTTLIFLNISKKAKAGKDNISENSKRKTEKNSEGKSWYMVGQGKKNRTSGLVEHRFNMELDLPKFLWAPCAQLYWLRPRNPSPLILADIRGRYWSAKIDDISWWPPEYRLDEIRVLHTEYPSQNRRIDGIGQDSMETWDRTIETGMAGQTIEEDKMLRKKDRALKTGQTWWL
jgi:hypothetical protein